MFQQQQNLDIRCVATKMNLSSPSPIDSLLCRSKAGFGNCWFMVYCCSHCLWRFCVWSYGFLSDTLVSILVFQSSLSLPSVPSVGLHCVIVEFTVILTYFYTIKLIVKFSILVNLHSMHASLKSQKHFNIHTTFRRQNVNCL